MVFDQIKKIAELKKLQDSFKKEKEIVEREGVLVEMNGNFEVENIKLNPELSAEKQQEVLKRCLNEARENIQKRLAKMMMSSGIGF
jgi:DNA-binding protein YbaB